MIFLLVYMVMFLYGVALLLIFLYSLAQLNLLVNYLRHGKKVEEDGLPFPEPVPWVTVQLPVYNERYVVRRLLENIARLEYPSGRLEIQVLDDSTDETVGETAAYVASLRETGLDIRHIRRSHRTGFKAGALREGLKTAKGALIAIFDADFLPGSDWLRKTVPHFKDPDIGVVQTRWAHLNRDYSLLTKIQAFALDAHFTLEQTGRNAKGHFINFNGTAGIWRKTCILDAGNWEGDTLTEDLDLSYRAQLRGWKFKYLEGVETPAELPVVMSAARSQQFRWNKGGAENFRKSVWKVVTAKRIPVKTRVHGVLHLLNSSMFLCVLTVALLSVPMLYIKHGFAELAWFFNATGFFVVSTVILFVCYWFTYKQARGGGFRSFTGYVGMFFTFFSVAMGLSFHNSVAVLEGHLGKRSAFVRTPKFNIRNANDLLKGNAYLKKELSFYTVMEGVLMLYFLFGMYSAFPLKNFALFPFHLMLFLGFGYVFFKSLFSKV